MSLSGLVCVASLCVPLIAGCGGVELKSHWRDRDVAVDGMDVPESEWQGARTYIEDADVAVGLLNDDEYLYVSLVTSDRMKLGQLIRSGLTLWFDPSGSDEKSFGIRFPLGGGGADPPAMRPGSRPDPEEMAAKMEELIEGGTDMEILWPGEDESLRLAIVEAKGIDVRVGISSGALIYELKVPLEVSADNPFGIGAEKGALVGVGFETPEMDFEQMRESSGGRSGGMGGRGGGMGGRGGGMGGRGGMGGGGRQMPEPLDVWIVARLAVEGDRATEINERPGGP
jgi:hypothetical protein